MTDQQTGREPTNSEIVAELRRVTAYFQLRTLAMHMGVPVDQVSSDPLRLRVTLGSPNGERG